MRVAENPVTTQEDAREITRRYARTFYFASFALPPEKRKAAYALYSFCRLVDKIADETADPSSSSVRLQLMRRRVEEVYTGSTSRPAKWTSGGSRRTISAAAA
jgi:phytoene synthase